MKLKHFSYRYTIFYRILVIHIYLSRIYLENLIRRSQVTSILPISFTFDWKTWHFFFFFDNGICNVLNYFFILFISFFSRIIIFIFCMLRNLIERTYLELEQKYYTRINEACWIIISPNHDTSCIQTRGKIEIDN